MAFYFGPKGALLKMHMPKLPDLIARHTMAPAAWAQLAQQLEAEQLKHSAAQDAGKAVGAKVRRATLAFQFGEFDGATSAALEAVSALKAVPAEIYCPDPHRNYALSGAIEAAASLSATLDFVRTGTFPSKPDYCDDTEYVSGLLGASSELSRYATRRATAGLHEAMLEFDLRNGPLRRKFDGLKYSLRRLEDLLYEQSLVGRSVTESTAAAAASRQEGALASLKVIKVSLDEHDAARERVIKQSRDVQKGAKQAIFALHRGDSEKAHALLAESTGFARAVLQDADLLVKWPDLRNGSFAAALEEWAEAALFAHWLENDGEVASPDQLPLQLTPDEYLGGIADLTGEIGRLAVAAATRRDGAAVLRVYATDLAVLEQLTTLPLPPKLNKKLDPLTTAVRKIETILYELSLAAASATAPKRPSSTIDDDAETKKPRNDDEDD